MPSEGEIHAAVLALVRILPMGMFSDRELRDLARAALVAAERYRNKRDAELKAKLTQS